MMGENGTRAWPFKCSRCADYSSYGYDGFWYCTQHWLEVGFLLYLTNVAFREVP